jgi:hypothetical protein
MSLVIKPNQLAELAGLINLKETKDVFLKSRAIDLSYKNLWNVSFSSIRAFEQYQSKIDKTRDLINMLAIDVSFSPQTISGEETPMGASVIDGVSGSGRTDIAMTVMDDAKGTIKDWFEARCAKMAKSDGTFGLPRDYLVQLDITHTNALKKGMPVKKYTYVVRPVALEVSLSRGESAVETLQLSFTQFDTFWSS